MADPEGMPIWYELMTSDAEGAEIFYADLVGWTVAPAPGNDAAFRGYRILTAPDGQTVGGLMTLPKGAPMKPGWFGYVGVPDVDAKADAIKQLGGIVHIGPMDIPGVGRFAFVADPQGMCFYIMRDNSPEPSKAFGMNAGHCGWNELVTKDHAAALDFYGRLFGWENKETMTMGEMGDYCFVDHAGQRLGAFMTAGPGWPTRWSYYFNVPSIDAAVEKIRNGGGAVTQGPHSVPGGMRIVLGTDPQGAAFALVGGR